MKNISLKEVELSSKTFNCLTKNGIYYLDELDDYSEKQLQEFKNLTQNMLSEIKKACSLHGVVIGGRQEREFEREKAYRKEIMESYIYKDAELILDTAKMLQREKSDYPSTVSTKEAIEIIKTAYIKELSDNIYALNSTLQDD